MRADDRNGDDCIVKISDCVRLRLDDFAFMPIEMSFYCFITDFVPHIKAAFDTSTRDKLKSCSLETLLRFEWYLKLKAECLKKHHSTSSFNSRWLLSHYWLFNVCPEVFIYSDFHLVFQSYPTAHTSIHSFQGYYNRPASFVSSNFTLKANINTAEKSFNFKLTKELP